MKRVTIQDIADKVGVTKGLVSRALRGKYDVSEKMREEITHAAVAMNYDFSKLRAKNKTRSKVLLVMTSKMLLEKDYWQPIIRVITATFEEKHVNLEYQIYDEETLGAEDVEKIKNVNAAGYVFMHNNPDVLVKTAENTGRPVVVIDPKNNLQGRHLQVKYSNFNSCYEITSLLIRGGHKNFLFYGATDESSSFIEREQGFSASISDNAASGVKGYKLLFKNAAGNYADNAGFVEILHKHPEISAVVCANDIIAINAMKSITKMGKKVPDDYAVAGFDNIVDSGYSNIDLTTVNVPREDLGREVAKYLVNHINKKHIKYSQIIIDCETVVRGSTGNINHTDIL